MAAATEQSVADLLQACEAPGSYANPLVKWDAHGAEIIVISDLHVGPGRNPNGCFTGTENFFADDALARFLNYAAGNLVKQPAILIINGDLVDFIRVTDIPKTSSEFQIWQEQLEEVGITKTDSELRSSISAKEVEFGLGTEEYKSVWKLHRVLRGHPVLFDALADWLARGNRLVLLKGNHDLELIWPAIRNTLRLALAQSIRAAQGAPFAEVLNKYIAPNLLFVDDSLLIEDFYVEHGHRYDKYATVLGDPILPGGQQLNLPFGLFVNRYVLNRVELAFPYTDNVRPTNDLLPMLFRQHFFMAIKLFLYNFPLAARTLFKVPQHKGARLSYFQYIFGHFIVTALALGIPLIVAIILLLAMIPLPQLQHAFQWLPEVAKLPGAKAFGTIAGFAGSYFLTRLVAYFQLAEPDALAANARNLLLAHNKYRIVTMGHTHNPDQFAQGERRYFNTGTWIPIIESSVAEVREDKTYTFLLLRRAGDVSFRTGWLQRWNDDAGRVEDLIIKQPKGETPASPEKEPAEHSHHLSRSAGAD